MVVTKEKNRTLTVVKEEDNYILEETVRDGCEVKIESVWLTANEIDKINTFTFLD